MAIPRFSNLSILLLSIIFLSAYAYAGENTINLLQPQNTTIPWNSSLTAQCNLTAGSSLNNAYIYMEENSTESWLKINTSSFVSGDPSFYCGDLKNKDTCSASWLLQAKTPGFTDIHCAYNYTQSGSVKSGSSDAVAITSEKPYLETSINVSTQEVEKTKYINATCYTSSEEQNTIIELLHDSAFVVVENKTCYTSECSQTWSVKTVERGVHNLQCHAISQFAETYSSNMSITIKSGYLSLSVDNISGYKTSNHSISVGILCITGYCGNVSLNITSGGSFLSATSPIKILSGQSTAQCPSVFMGDTCALPVTIEFNFGSKSGTSNQFEISASSDDADVRSVYATSYATAYTGTLSIAFQNAEKINVSDNTTLTVTASCIGYCGFVNLTLEGTNNHCGKMQDTICTYSTILNYNTSGNKTVSASAYSDESNAAATTIIDVLEIHVAPTNTSSNNNATISADQANNTVLNHTINQSASSGMQSQIAEINDTSAYLENLSQNEESNKIIDEQEKEIIVNDLKQTKQTLSDMLKTGNYQLGSAKEISDSIITLSSLIASLENNEISSTQAKEKASEIKSSIDRLAGQVTGKAAATPANNTSFNLNIASLNLSNISMPLIAAVIAISITVILIRRKRMNSDYTIKKEEKTYVDSEKEPDDKDKKTIQVIAENKEEKTDEITENKETEIPSPTEQNDDKEENDFVPFKLIADSRKMLEKPRYALKRSKAATMRYLQYSSTRKQIEELRRQMDKNYYDFSAGKKDHTDYEHERELLISHINKLRMYAEKIRGRENA